uniref:PK_Tyr_Ser-Thr domain-containing protein n=1 Tax=Loa loa TaxID=7209 RepID=A0A1I7VA96_LOALO
MQKCWEQNPDDRYDMKQVVQFFEDYLECRARKKKQVRMTETTELTMKDGEDAVEEYLKRNGKSGNKTITKMDSNTTKIIKELQDF